MLIRARTASIVVASLLAVSSGPAAATITGLSDVTGANGALVVDGGDIPNPVTKNPNNGLLIGWDERQNVTLTSDLRVDRVFDSTASFVEDAGGGDWVIKAGTIVSSHYFQWDPGNGSVGNVNATLKLDSQVFAFMTEDGHLQNSDSVLGLPGVDYNDFLNRGLESSDTTNFVGPDVEISWNATSPGDWTRLITAFSPSAAPELTTGNSDGTASSLDFGQVRVGTSASLNLEIDNTGGEQPGGLSGYVPDPLGSDGFSLTDPDTFGPLGPGATALRGYGFAPASRGARTALLDPIASNDPNGSADGDAPVTLTGTGTGPVAALAEGGSPLSNGDTVDLLTAWPTDTDTVIVTVLNNSTDPTGALSDLTLNDILIGGSDAGKFSLLNGSPGQVIAAGGSFDLQIQFAPAGALGDFSATLTLLTDEGAALGADGNDYLLNLDATATPEPATLSALLALGAAGLVRRRKGVH